MTSGNLHSRGRDRINAVTNKKPASRVKKTRSRVLWWLGGGCWVRGLGRPPEGLREERAVG